MNRYKYHPLQHHDSIRILLLHPSSDIFAPITCTIQHIRFSDSERIQFEALSYTWGEIVEKTIYLQDERTELPVRQSCYNALRHLRGRDKIRQLWIDAICIDQANFNERASQVCMMDEIFNSAFNVVVYLGEHDEGSTTLFKELEAAEELLQHSDVVDRPLPNDTLVQELDRLYQRPWFKRVWVLQEVCDKSRVHIMCGSTSVSMEALVKLNFGYGKRYYITKTKWPQALEWNYRPPHEFSTSQFELWNRLYHSRGCVATDPRDRVFALRSLLGSKRSELDPLIDYTKSLEQCFVDVVRFLLPVLGLRILVAIRHPHTKSMPSWIPDWSQNLPLQFNLFWDEEELFSPNQSKPSSGLFYSPFNETEYLIRSFEGKDQKQGLELLVTGCRYAEVVARSEVFSFDSVEDAEKQTKRLFPRLFHPRTSTGSDNILSETETSKILGQDIMHAMSLITGDHLHQGLGRGFETAKGDAHEPFHKEHFQELFESLQQRRITLLDNGETAIGPSDVKCGDAVCILQGTVSACVLRPDQDGTWVLVSGDCYLFWREYYPDWSPMWFMSDDYISDNYERAETFVIR